MGTTGQASLLRRRSVAHLPARGDLEGLKALAWLPMSPAQAKRGSCLDKRLRHARRAEMEFWNSRNGRIRACGVGFGLRGRPGLTCYCRQG